MNLYICEICGKAHIGVDKPSDCPFCGAKGNFLKDASAAKPITEEKIELSDQSIKNLEETLSLEQTATALYLCMAGKTKDFKIKAIYERLAAVEQTHADIAANFLGISRPEIAAEACSDQDLENFKKTIELEDRAVELYTKFTLEAPERNVKLFFVALTQVEKGHAELIRDFLK